MPNQVNPAGAHLEINRNTLKIWRESDARHNGHCSASSLACPPR
jgi:hypothetical protein